jgi:hypothetical protein
MDDAAQGAAAGRESEMDVDGTPRPAVDRAAPRVGAATRVLEALLGANAVAPSGDAPVAPSGIARADLVEALHEALCALHERDRARERRDRLPANVGKPWTAEHDAALLAAFDAGTPLDEIAARLQRTRVGVRTRLERHGRLAPV